MMGEERRQWWQVPRLHTEGESGHERRVSWLELFFDLVFVVVIAQLAHALADHPDWSGVQSFVLLSIPVFWIWVSATIYNDRFETEDISYRLITFAQMVPVAALALFVKDGLGKTSVGFALAYAASRLLITLLWLRAGWHNPLFRPVTNRYVLGFSLSVLLFVVSTVIPPPQRFALWAVALLIDFLTPVTTLHLQSRLPRFTLSKLTERYGLFTIIVLGEAVVSVVSGVADGDMLTPLIGLELIVGLALVFGIWWVYFDFVARRLPRRGSWWTITWSYLHLPLLLGITATAAGILDVLKSGAGPTSDNIRWLVVVSAAIVLIAIALLEFVLAPAEHEPTHRWLSPALKVAGALGMVSLGLASGLGGLALLAAILLCLLVQMVYGAYVWFTTPAATAEH
jgi:low temperature requirement protein LtrA